MGAHFKNSSNEIGKKGVSVQLKKIIGTPEEVAKASVKALDTAIRTLKRKMKQEGVIRDMKRKEYYESKSQIRRKNKEIAIKKFKKEESQKEW